MFPIDKARMNPHSLATALVIPLAGSSFTTFLLIPLMIVAFYFLLIRPQRKRQKEQQRLLSLLEPGSHVLTHTGIFGTIVSIGDKQAVLEIAPGIRVTVLRQTIARAARPEDVDSALDDETPAEGLTPVEPGGVSPEPVDTIAPDTIASTDPAGADESANAAVDHRASTESGGIRDVTSSYFARPGEEGQQAERDA